MNLFKHFFTILGLAVLFSTGASGQTNLQSAAKVKVNAYLTQINALYGNEMDKKLAKAGLAYNEGYFTDLVIYDFGKLLLKNLNSQSDIFKALEITNGQYYPSISASSSGNSNSNASGSKSGLVSSVSPEVKKEIIPYQEKAFGVYKEILSNL